MPTWHYSVKPVNEAKTAKAVLFDIPVSVKYMREIANTIKGMKLVEAMNFLEEVIKLRQPVPFRRYHGKLSHKRGLADRFKWPIGRYPVKGAKYTLELLKNVKANAENKGLDVDKLVIVHISAHKGPTIKRYMPRAFGRATPKFRRTTHMEVVVEEVS
ncbi:MAG: 50S ribosomal protein L22 [Desulfurococcaceae archaeon]|jgi:large subunit ribosomal protein L22